MKTFALTCTVLLAALGLAATIDAPLRPKQGAKWKQTSTIELDLGGNAAVVNVSTTVEVKEASEKLTKLFATHDALKVEVSGNPIDVEASDLQVELGPKLEVQRVRGGIDGSDALQFFLVGHFIPPATEPEPGAKYTVDVPEVKDQTPAYKYEGEFVGKETLDGATVLKFKGNLTVAGQEGLTSNGTFWVHQDGRVAKAETTFKNMDVPAAGMKGEGKLKLSTK